jgi:hypothetical protein
MSWKALRLRIDTRQPTPLDAGVLNAAMPAFDGRPDLGLDSLKCEGF